MTLKLIYYENIDLLKKTELEKITYQKSIPIYPSIINLSSFYHHIYISTCLSIYLSIYLSPYVEQDGQYQEEDGEAGHGDHGGRVQNKPLRRD